LSSLQSEREREKEKEECKYREEHIFFEGAPRGGRRTERESERRVITLVSFFVR